MSGFALWPVVDEERSRLADLLDGLSDADWRRPSLCAGWTVRDVAAHLTLQQLRLRDVLGTILRWRGDMNRTIEHEARRKAAARSTAEIVGEIRGMVGSRAYNVGLTPAEPLIDLLVHTQDIALPLGLEHDMPLRAAVVAADRVLSMRWPPPPSSVAAVSGFRLVATDVDWSTGRGTEVHGPMAALLLTCCGRDAVLGRLTGPGAPSLARRLTEPSV